jgi:hypothetical protein
MAKIAAASRCSYKSYDCSDAVKTLTHAYDVRLEFEGITEKLWAVSGRWGLQNVAARLVIVLARQDHNEPVLHSYILAVRHKIYFKMAGTTSMNLSDEW